MICCNPLFRCNQTCYCAGIVSVTSMSRYQSPLKVDPLYTAKVDSMELADVRADWLAGLTSDSMTVLT